MEFKVFATVFVTVFVAELGDKTQLATMLYAADANISRWVVFAAAAAALITATALGVLAGAAVGSVVPERYLRWVAGAGFVLVGLWIMLRT